MIQQTAILQDRSPVYGRKKKAKHISLLGTTTDSQDSSSNSTLRTHQLKRKRRHYFI